MRIRYSENTGFQKFGVSDLSLFAEVGDVSMELTYREAALSPSGVVRLRCELLSGIARGLGVEPPSDLEVAASTREGCMAVLRQFLEAVARRDTRDDVRVDEETAEDRDVWVLAPGAIVTAWERAGGQVEYDDPMITFVPPEPRPAAEKGTYTWSTDGSDPRPLWRPGGGWSAGSLGDLYTGLKEQIPGLTLQAPAKEEPEPQVFEDLTLERIQAAWEQAGGRTRKSPEATYLDFLTSTDEDECACWDYEAGDKTPLFLPGNRWQAATLSYLAAVLRAALPAFTLGAPEEAPPEDPPRPTRVSHRVDSEPPALAAIPSKTPALTLELIKAAWEQAGGACVDEGDYVSFYTSEDTPASDTASWGTSRYCPAMWHPLLHDWCDGTLYDLVRILKEQLPRFPLQAPAKEEPEPQVSGGLTLGRIKAAWERAGDRCDANGDYWDFYPNGGAEGDDTVSWTTDPIRGNTLWRPDLRQWVEGDLEDLCEALQEQNPAFTLGAPEEAPAEERPRLATASPRVDSEPPKMAVTPHTAGPSLFSESVDAPQAQLERTLEQIQAYWELSGGVVQQHSRVHIGLALQTVFVDFMWQGVRAARWDAGGSADTLFVWEGPWQAASLNHLADVLQRFLDERKAETHLPLGKDGTAQPPHPPILEVIMAHWRAAGGEGFRQRMSSERTDYVFVVDDTDFMVRWDVSDPAHPLSTTTGWGPGSLGDLYDFLREQLPSMPASGRPL